MKRKKYGLILWILAALALIIATGEGWVYYARYNPNPLFHLLMAAENGFKVFLSSPTVSLASVLDSLKDISPLRWALAYAYAFSVFIAPLCTATALFIWAELVLRQLMSGWIKYKGTPILIFGWNETVRALVAGEYEDNTKKYQIHVVTAEKLSDADELWLLRHRAVPHQMDLLLVSGRRKKKLLGQFPFKQADRVLLMEDSPTRNISLYQSMVKDEDSLPDLAPATKYYCLCEDDATRAVIEAACDQRVADAKAKREQAEENAKAAEPGHATGEADGENVEDATCTEPDETESELILFSLAEMKADSIFSPLSEDAGPFKPLHDMNKSAQQDIHVLIVGFGAVGQQVLLQVLNLGVLSSRNRLCIDVVDLEADQKWSFFSNRFHPSVNASDKKNELRLTAPTADGELQIRFHQVDIRSQDFARLLEQLNGEMALTYTIVCTRQTDIGMHCIAELGKLAGSFPIALRMEQDLLALNYLKQKDSAPQKEQDDNPFKNMFPIAINDRILRISNICNDEREKRARQFHEIYSAIKSAIQPDEGEKWAELPMYKRRANVLLWRHQAVKEVFGKLRPAVLEGCFGENGTILRRQPGSRYCYCHDDRAATAKAISDQPKIRELAMTEHRRWCYIMAAQGWHFTEGQKVDARRETPCMTTWDKLCQNHPEMAIYDLIAYLTDNASLPEQAAKQQ